MKISLLLVNIFLFAPVATLFAQISDSNDSTVIKQNFNNKKKPPHSNDFFATKDIQKHKGNTIVILNKKIYAIDSKEFRLMNKNEIISMEVINDESSATRIKNIIIIETKEKPKNDG